jgi:PAS domain S-box-containing protein
LARIANLTPMISNTQLQHDTETLNNAFPDFSALHVEDETGHTIVFSPSVNVKGQSTIGHDFSDRIWFQRSRSSKDEVISEIIQGRIGTFAPLAVIVAPMKRENQFIGTAAGSIDLGIIQEMLKSYGTGSALDITLSDSNNQIIASTNAQRMPLQIWNRKSAGSFEFHGNNLFFWHPNDRKLPSMTRWKRSFYVKEILFHPSLSWTITLEEPVAPLQHILYTIYVKNLTIMAVLIGFSLFLTFVLSNWLVRPLTQLAQVTADLPEKINESHEIHWPAENVREIGVLILNYRSMAKILEANIHNLKTQSEGLRQTAEALSLRESYLTAIIENQPGLLWLKDTEGHFLSVNQAFAKSCGKNNPDEVVSKTDLDIWPRELAEKYIKDDSEVTKRQQPIAVEEIVKDQGIEKWFQTFKTPVFSPNGLVIGTCGFSLDVTERKRSEKDRRLLEERLQRAEKMEALGTLAGGVAHDLNNVLGIVVGYSELLADDLEEPSPERLQAIEILKAGQRAAAIVQDLLTLARRGVINKKVLNLNDIIEECQKTPEISQLFSYHPNVRMTTDLDVDLLCISGSSVHLMKSLFNLISNATEAMPNGGSVDIKTRNFYLDRPISGYDEVKVGDYVVINVSDTGEGIPSSDLRRIFEPFYTKKVMGRSGTGLGLAVVWGTVKDHQGYINVESQMGKGTKFTLYFPVTREEICVDKSKVSSAMYMGNGESILIVDDVKEQCELAAAMLKKLNYNVISVSSGEKAVQYLKHNPFDLVVLDMIMDPGMDGLETYTKILEHNPHQKAIIVSGYSETDRVSKALELGAGSYVKKPYVLEKLGLSVRKELNGSI